MQRRINRTIDSQFLVNFNGTPLQNVPNVIMLSELTLAVRVGMPVRVGLCQERSDSAND